MMGRRRVEKRMVGISIENSQWDDHMLQLFVSINNWFLSLRQTFLECSANLLFPICHSIMFLRYLTKHFSGSLLQYLSKQWNRFLEVCVLLTTWLLLFFLFVNSGKSLNVALPGFSDAVGLTVLSKVFCKACSTSLLLYTFPPPQSVLLADCQPADCFSTNELRKTAFTCTTVLITNTYWRDLLTLNQIPVLL